MTPMQKKALDYITDYIAEFDGVSPSFQNIADGLGIKSKSGAHRLVWALHDMGAIHVSAGRGRRITIPGADTNLSRAATLSEVRAIARKLLSGSVTKENAARKLLVLAAVK